MADMENTVAEVTAVEKEPAKRRLLRLIKKGLFVFFAAIFWLWQIAFVVLMLFTIVPEFLPQMWAEFRHSDLPMHYLFLTVLLVCLPMVCLVFICWLMFSKRSDRTVTVLKFFYGFELPALLIIALYLMNLRDYGAGMSWFLFIACVALGMWLFLVFLERREPVQSRVKVFLATNPVAMAGSTVLFAVGVFVSLASLLFIVPIGIFILVSFWELVQQISWPLFTFAELITFFKEFNWLDILLVFELLLSIPLLAGLILSLTSLMLIGIMPFALIYLYIGQFIQRLWHSPSSIKTITTVGVLMLLVGVHFYSNIQPQQKIFALLETPTQSAEQRAELLAQSEDIRAGLMNAYLARYRYMSSTGSASVLTDMYTGMVKLDVKWAEYAQKTLNALLMPILYNGDNRTDTERAAEQYEAFFDTPIQKAESEEIWRTLDYNLERSAQNAAGLLDVNQRSVYMQSQSIDVAVENQLATITTTQKLVNKGDRRQEAVVHFSLAEYATVTGVWLSNDETDLQQHTFLVSPRGAAQAVYKQQVAMRIDPALLEKVGPELYRLRVYPILAARGTAKQALVGGEPMYVTLEYQTLANQQGEWPLPQVLEQRQVYWDENTEQTINGVTVEERTDNGWLPEAVASTDVVAPEPVEMSTGLGKTTWAVPAQYVDSSSIISTMADAESRSNYAVIVDGSRSMHSYEQEIISALEELSGASLYFCQDLCTAISVSDMPDQLYWGNSKPIEQLQAFLNTTNNDDVDAIIMLTDDGSYEAENNEQGILSSDSPVWVLHLAGKRPYAYSDAWLSTVNQSNGGFSHRGVDDLLEKIAIVNSEHNLRLTDEALSAMDIDVVDLVVSGVTQDWIWLDKIVTTNTDVNNTYAKLGAALEIAQATKTGLSLGIEQLDTLHRVAAKAGIVTELSSMIVLVNDAQRQALTQAEKQDDRFDRENEDGTQMVTMPGDSLSVAAVPEPREWAMLVIVMMFVSVSLYRRRGRVLIPT